MSPFQPIDGAPRGPQGAPGASPSGARPAAAGSEVSQGAAFRALLEQLELRARELSEKSQSELDPEELAGAVDQARESMHDALGLQEKLLEAWRQSRHERQADGTA